MRDRVGQPQFNPLLSVFALVFFLVAMAEQEQEVEQFSPHVARMYQWHLLF